MSRLLLASLLCLRAFAADPFYFGTWKIESASVAPWWQERERPDPSESKTLLGKTLVITAKSITGPRQVLCRNPHYQVKDDPAEMLFQGSFGEMHERNQSVDPAAVAAQVGFVGKSWKTVETGCGNELDFHFLHPSAFAFGLNNYIYILKKVSSVP